MKTVVITSFHPHISRNILSTEAFRILVQNPKLRIVLAVPDYKVDFFTKEYATNERISVFGIEPYQASRTLRGRFFKRLGVFLFDTQTARNRKKYEYYFHGKYIIYYFSRLLGIIGHSFIFRRLVRFLDLWCAPKTSASRMLSEIKPDMLFSTDLQNENDVSIMHAARKGKIPILGMLRSWDNPTQRILRVLPEKMIVGSNVLEEEVRLLYRYPPAQIVITGNPHYDRYLKGPTMSKDKFLKSLNLPLDKKLILYAPVSDALIYHNDIDEYVLSLLGDVDASVLVRFPPEKPVRLSGDFKQPQNMVYDRPGVSFNARRVGDREIRREDDSRLIDSLYHADVVVTGPTSITIDAALIDRPVIAVHFYPTPREFFRSVYRYEDNQIVKVRETGGIHVSVTKEDFLKTLASYLENPRRDAKGREKIRSMWFSHADGSAGRRVADAVLDFLTV